MGTASGEVSFQDRMLSLGVARVSEAAAIAVSRLIGRGDEEAAQAAAVKAMHSELNLLNIRGTVVIGDGEREETPTLYVGEEVGTGQGEEVDIGLHPLEGKTLAAKARPNALSVVVMAPRCSMLPVPEIYMEKLAVGPGYPDVLLDLDMPPAERVRVLAAAKGCSPEEVRITVLERPRHAELIAELRSIGASVRLISDADVAGVMHCSRPEETGIDVYMGSGGAQQGVLGAAALKCMGGQMQGRLLFRNPHEADLARRAGIEDLDAKYSLDDLIRADVLFAATGVTNSSLLRGARRVGEFLETETLLLRSHTGSLRRLTYRTKDF